MRRAVVIVGLVAFACGHEPPSSMTADLGPTGLLALPEHGVQLATNVRELDPGREVTLCYNLNLNNDAPMDVVRFETARLPGLHHFNIFASHLERNDGFGPCPNNDELFGDARPIVDGSGNTVDYVFPDGLAVQLEPKTLIVAQLHFINASAVKAREQFVLNLHTSVDPVGTLVDIYGLVNFDINLPPHQVTEVSKDCAIYDNIRVLTMSAHFHARGIRAAAKLIVEGQPEQMLYETDSWAEPKVERFDAPMYVGNGAIIRFSCTYDNEDDFTVNYGPSAKDEMCFVFGYYYPKVGLIPCF